jgi:hypothetical protein
LPKFLPGVLSLCVVFREDANPLDLDRDSLVGFGNHDQIDIARQPSPVPLDEGLDHAGLYIGVCGNREFFEEQFARRRKRNQPVDNLALGSIRNLLIGLRAGAVKEANPLIEACAGRR